MLKKFLVLATMSMAFATNIYAQETQTQTEQQSRMKAFADSITIQYNKKQDSEFVFPEKENINYEVIYFYSYACPHCYEFDSYVQEWKKQMKPDVSFRYLPVTFQKGWDVVAKGSIIADDLKLNNFSNNIYEYIHKKGYKITKMEELRDFFDEEYSVDSSVFNSLYNSVDVNVRIENYNTITDNFEVEGTPSLILITRDEKSYITSPSIAQGPVNAIFSLEYLMAKDRSEKAKEVDKKKSTK